MPKVLRDNVARSVPRLVIVDSQISIWTVQPSSGVEHWFLWFSLRNTYLSNEAPSMRTFGLFGLDRGRSYEKWNEIHEWAGRLLGLTDGRVCICSWTSVRQQHPVRQLIGKKIYRQKECPRIFTRSRNHSQSAMITHRQTILDLQWCRRCKRHTHTISIRIHEVHNKLDISTNHI